jgi:hypothetical protein
MREEKGEESKIKKWLRSVISSTTTIIIFQGGGLC